MKSNGNSAQSIIFFDADCGVCTASVNWLVRQSHGNLLSIAYQDDVGMGKYPVIDSGHAESGVQLLLPGGAMVLRDARAIAASLKQTGWLGWSVGTIIDLPGLRILSQIGYQIFAANRRHISKLLGLQACKLPSRS